MDGTDNSSYEKKMFTLGNGIVCSVLMGNSIWLFSFNYSTPSEWLATTSWEPQLQFPYSIEKTVNKLASI